MNNWSKIGWGLADVNARKLVELEAENSALRAECNALREALEEIMNASAAQSSMFGRGIANLARAALDAAQKGP